MKLNFENETDAVFQFDEDAESVIENAVTKTAQYMKFPYEYEVNVVLIDKEEMRKINLEQRGIDRATDVLSFPMIEYDEPGGFDIIDINSYEYVDPDSKNVCLGDIVLSCDAIKEQAKEYGHSQLREMSFLVVHSMLHLFGYDHMDEEDKTMEELQKDILLWMNIPR